MIVPGIEFPRVVHLTYSSLGLIWQLTHCNSPLPPKYPFLCANVFHISISEYAQLWTNYIEVQELVASILRIAKKCWMSSWRKTPRLTIKKLFFSYFVLMSSKNGTHFLFSTMAFIVYIWYRVIIGICFAYSFEYIM